MDDAFRHRLIFRLESRARPRNPRGVGPRSAQKRSNLDPHTRERSSAPTMNDRRVPQAVSKLPRLPARQSPTARRGTAGSVDSRRDGRAGRDARLGREPDPSGVAGTPAALSPAGGSRIRRDPGDAAPPGGKRGEARRTSPESPPLAGADASRARAGARTRTTARVEPAVSARASRAARPRAATRSSAAPRTTRPRTPRRRPATGEARRVTLEQRRRRARGQAATSRRHHEPAAAARAPRDAGTRATGRRVGPATWNVGGRRGGDARGVVVRSSDPEPEPGSIESPAAERDPRASPARRPGL